MKTEIVFINALKREVIFYIGICVIVIPTPQNLQSYRCLPYRKSWKLRLKKKAPLPWGFCYKGEGN